MKIIKKIIKRIYFLRISKKRKIKIKSKTNIDFKTTFEGQNIVNRQTSITNSRIGFGTYIGEKSHIINTIIGRYCSIASNVKVIADTHPTFKFVSTHPAFFSINKQAGFTYVDIQKFEEYKYIDVKEKISVIIGNDVWIGENVTIIGGVKIGDGAIIGANAVVTKDIEPYSINVGVPAKKIKYRFQESEIEFLEKLKWWDKPKEWIMENAELFEDINILKGRM